MTDAVTALLAEAEGLERASRLQVTNRLAVPAPFEQLLPEAGLKPGSTYALAGIGAHSLALALVSRASADAWTAVVGLPRLGLRAAAELGIALDRLVVIGDPGAQSVRVVAALVDAFDIVLSSPIATRDARRVNARVRERDAVLVAIGRWPESDVLLEGTGSTWHGIGSGYGHLVARTLDVTATGRRGASRPRRATLWLPDPDGNMAVATQGDTIPMQRTS